MIKLADLLKEKERRQKAREGTGPGKPKTALETWKEERDIWAKRYQGTGLEILTNELMNMLDGLTPKGFDRNGVNRSRNDSGRSKRNFIDFPSKPVYISKK